MGVSLFLVFVVVGLLRCLLCGIGFRFATCKFLFRDSCLPFRNGTCGYKYVCSAICELLATRSEMYSILYYRCTSGAIELFHQSIRHERCSSELCTPMPSRRDICVDGIMREHFSGKMSLLKTQ